jgi:hypothetical protein
MRNKGTKSWLGAMILMTAASTVQAQSTAPAPEPAAAGQSTTSAVIKNIRERAKASYTLWVTGSSLESMDGKKGAGSNLAVDQFARIGYKVSSKWTIGVTQHWTNTIRDVSGNKENLVWNNPYITASNSSITKSTRYGTNLSGYVRYYAPFSKASAESVGKRVDTKNGVIRVVLDPTKTFFDGKMTVSGAVYANRSLASAPPSAGVAEQRDWRIYLYPRVSYEVSSNFQPYVAYFNDWEHVRLDKNRNGGGRWQSFNDKHNLEIGFDWQPVAGLNVTPYLEYGPTFVPRNSTVGLIAEYAFL